MRYSVRVWECEDMRVTKCGVCECKGEDEVECEGEYEGNCEGV